MRGDRKELSAMTPLCWFYLLPLPQPSSSTSLPPPQQQHLQRLLQVNDRGRSGAHTTNLLTNTASFSFSLKCSFLPSAAGPAGIKPAVALKFFVLRGVYISSTRRGRNKILVVSWRQKPVDAPSSSLALLSARRLSLRRPPPPPSCPFSPPPPGLRVSYLCYM